LPCDALIDDARTQADRAISISAPPAIVFSWLCQLRIAPYSYDILDNFGRRSPRQRTPELAQLETGQRFMTVFTLHSFIDCQQLSQHNDFGPHTNPAPDNWSTPPKGTL
jgi:hypothetical protein